MTKITNEVLKAIFALLLVLIFVVFPISLAATEKSEKISGLEIIDKHTEISFSGRTAYIVSLGERYKKSNWLFESEVIKNKLSLEVSEESYPTFIVGDPISIEEVQERRGESLLRKGWTFLKKPR